MNFRSVLSALFLFLLAISPMKIFANTNPDSTGLPGDNLDLPAVLDLFKNSTNLEEFEKKLNTKDNKVNNLDLDGDKQVDYIRVVDIVKNNIHVFVLRDPVSQKESQDVAVIELEKKSDGVAHLQIVGDKELYGEKFIVEPRDESKKDSIEGRWKGFAAQVYIVNVWYWPCVQYVYYPGYIIYVSPWYWMFWPVWWNPWPPYPYYMYYGYVYYHHENCYYSDEYRNPEAHSYYGPRRVVSSEVQKRNAPAMVRYKEQKKLDAKNPTPPKQKGDAPPTKNVPAKPDMTPQPAPAPKGDVPKSTPPPPTPLPEPPPPRGNIPPPIPAPTPQPPPRPHVTPQTAPPPRGDVRPPRSNGTVRPRLFRKHQH